MTVLYASYGFLGSFLVTTLAGRWLPIHADGSLALLLLGGIVSGLVYRHSRRLSLVIIACTVGIVLGTHTIDRTREMLRTNTLDTVATGETRTVTGIVDAMPDRRPRDTRYVLRTEEVDGQSVQGRVLVYDSAGFPEYEYGDRIQVTGKLRLPEPFETFDYPAYLKTKRIDALMGYANVKTGEPATLSMKERTFRLLYGIRTSLETRIQLLLPEPHASLLIGFITGSRSGLSEEINEQFRITGTSHIVAVSGYNVTLVLAIASSFLFWLPIKKRFIPLSVGIVCYMLLTGAGAPVVRASIMGFLGLLALQSSRQSTPRLSILWTAFFMTLWDPLDLWYDPGFQLSFLAVLGITELTPVLNRLFSKIPKTLGVRESLIATVAAQIATLPVSALTFGQFSLVAPLTNLLVAPMIPLSMVSGMLAVFLSFGSMQLGLPVAYLSWAFLEWILLSVRLTSMVPWAQILF